MEELCQSKRCSQAFCIYSHGFAWMYAFRNTGTFSSLSSLPCSCEWKKDYLDLPFPIVKYAENFVGKIYICALEEICCVIFVFCGMSSMWLIIMIQLQCEGLNLNLCSCTICFRFFFFLEKVPRLGLSAYNANRFIFLFALVFNNDMDNATWTEFRVIGFCFHQYWWLFFSISYLSES